MTRNRDAPATAMVMPPPGEPAVQHEPFFYPCSTTKVLILSVLLWGLYPLWWFWTQLRAEAPDEGRVSAALKTIFSGLFFYTVARQVKEAAAIHGVKCRYSPAVLTAILWASGIGAMLTPPIGQLIAGLAITLSFLLVQLAINRIHRDVYGRGPMGWSRWEITLAMIFGLFWSLAIIGLLIGPAPTEGAR